MIAGDGLDDSFGLTPEGLEGEAAEVATTKQNIIRGRHTFHDDDKKGDGLEKKKWR